MIPLEDLTVDPLSTVVDVGDQTPKVVVPTAAPPVELNPMLLAADSPDEIPPAQIDTGGGAYVAGNATVGGDLVGHDKVIQGDEVHGDKITNVYITAAEPPVAPPSPLLATEITRRPFEPETVLIPAGAFIMGDDNMPNALPRLTVELPVYRIGKTPITNGEYAEFLKHNPAQPEPDKQHWFLRQPKKGFSDHPVVNVTWHDAQAYCAWLSQVTGRHYSLPTEAQWEKAGRGASGQLYPWGNAWQDGYANIAGYAESSGTTPVFTFLQAVSPYGCLDLLGNVQEWTSTPWGEEEPPSAYGVRGGSFRSLPDAICCSTRESIHPTAKVAWRGFRVILYTHVAHGGTDFNPCLLGKVR